MFTRLQMINPGCDTIFNDQDTNENLSFLTQPIKKIFLSNELTIPQIVIKSNYQTPQTKQISLNNTEQKSFQKFQSQLVIQNDTQLQISQFKPITLNQKQGNEEHKPCNCKKSKCLKLYCDCFAVGKLCTSKCNCCGCFNNSSNLLERNSFIQKMIERNPLAFNQKVQEVESKMTHTKGCNCRKSGCQKKYCECYQLGIECSDNCKCDGCLNCSSNTFTKYQDTSQYFLNRKLNF